MIAFNLEELWSIYYGTLMIWSYVEIWEMWQMFERQFQNEIYPFYTSFAHRWNREGPAFRICKNFDDSL